MVKPAFVIAAAALLAACATHETSETRFNQLAAQVEDEIRVADATGFLWRDTDMLLEQARIARQQGQEDVAVGLAQRALRQAKLAQQQARDNAKAAPSYPSN